MEWSRIVDGKEAVGYSGSSEKLAARWSSRRGGILAECKPVSVKSRVWLGILCCVVDYLG